MKRAIVIERRAEKSIQARRATLADLVAGASLACEGCFSRPAFVTIAHACQQPHWTLGSVRKRLAGDGIDETRFRRITAAPRVSESLLERPFESLTFVQQKKIELARSIANPADLLIRDEPLNFIDARSEAYMASLTAELLDGTNAYVNNQGRELRDSLSVPLAHVSSHKTHHRGQMPAKTGVDYPVLDLHRVLVPEPGGVAWG